MAPVIGKCALCLLDGQELRKSHLHAAGVYRELRDPLEPNADPITITADSAIMMSDQVQDYLLCQRCEDLLSKKGETWVLSQMRRADGQFNLRDKLIASTSAMGFPRIEVYSALTMRGVEVDKLLHFACSVLWRSAVHPWRLRKHQLRAVDLGPYEPTIRQYLLGGTFPQSVFVWLSVIPPTPAEGGVVFPHGSKDDGYHKYLFTIPGLAFHVFIGQKVPPLHQQMSLNGTNECIFYGDLVEEGVVRQLGPLAVRSTPRGKLAKSLAIA